MSRRQLRGILDLTRPGNVVAAGLLAIAGAFVATGSVTETTTAIAALVTMCAVGGGNAINDYFDRDIDQLTNPDRPIPSGQVSPRLALSVSGTLLATAAGSIVFLPRVAQLIALANTVLLVAYTSKFKGQPGVGNIVVGYLTGSALWFGAAAVGAPFTRTVLVLSAVAAIATVARELIKDIEDIEGDRKEGLQTFPIVFGGRLTRHVAAACVVGGVIISPLPFVWENELGLVYLGGVFVANSVLVWGMYQSWSDVTTGQQWLKRGMFVALAAFVVGQATGI